MTPEMFFFYFTASKLCDRLNCTDEIRCKLRLGGDDGSPLEGFCL